MIFKDKNFNLVWLLIVTTSLIVGIIIYLDSNKPSYYAMLPLLPLIFGLINLIFIMLFKNIYKNLGLIMIIGLYYIRFVIVPIIMLLGDYSSFLKFNIYSNMPNTIILMVYEVIIVYLIMYWMRNKKNTNTNNVNKPIKYDLNYSQIFKIVLFSILIFDIAILLFIPESRKLYSSLFSTLNKSSSELIYIDNIAVRGNIKRVFLTLFTMTVEILRVLLPAYFIVQLRKKFGESKTGLLLSVPFILIQFMLVSNTHARSVICAVALMLVLTKLYPKWSKKLYQFSLAFGLIFVVGYFAYKGSLVDTSNSENSYEYASNIANAYFSGPDNIAGTFNVDNYDRWETLKYTLISAIPFNGSIFGISGYNYSSIYNLYNKSEFQIGPLISESYYYFGFIFSPMASVILTLFTIHYGNKAFMENNIIKFVVYIYFIIILASSLILYNGTIFLKTFTSVIVPLLILATVAKKNK